VPPAVLDLATQRTAAAGEIVCTPDQPLDALTLVISGRLRLDKDGHTIRAFGPGDYFGEGGLVRDAGPSVTITATEPTDLLEFRRDALTIIMDTQPSFGLSFLQAVLAETMARLQATNQLFADNRALAHRLSQTVDHLEGALSEARESEQRLRALAGRDTRLGSLAMLHDRLEAARQQPGIPRFALHMIDLDHVPAVDAGTGLTIGDKVLALAAERLDQLTRTADSTARRGGDKFAVLQPLDATDEAAKVGALAQRLIEGLSAPMTIDGEALQVGTSIGIALYPDDGVAADALIGHADLALQRAKTEGRGRAVFFTPALGEQASRLATLKASLRAPDAAAPRRDAAVQRVVVTVSLPTAGALRDEDVVALVADALAAADLPGTIELAAETEPA
jgi:diguanylate cyclase (GGDEF)-like protein